MHLKLSLRSSRILVASIERLKLYRTRRSSHAEHEAGAGLIRPELAVLLASAKVAIAEKLLQSDLV